MANIVDEHEDELYHYGVQGMKWGVRRGRAALGNAKGNLKRMSGNRDKRHKLAKEVAGKAAGNAKGNATRMSGNRDRRRDAIKKLVGKPGSKRYKALEKTAEEAVTNKIKKRVVSDTKTSVREVGKFVANQVKHPLLYGKAVAKHAAKNPSSLIVLTANDIKSINKAIDADVASKKRK